MPSLPKRRRPAKRILILPDETTIGFVTCCTKGRVPWLADERCHTILSGIWKSADAWLVGRYVIMPDHVHLFASPGNLNISLDDWIQYWKSLATKAIAEQDKRWQRDSWHRRLRCGDSYSAKWLYARENPVRKGLVGKPEDWPFQGELYALRWWENRR